MRKYYICPKSVYEEIIPGLGLQRACWLSGGSSYALLDDDHILICGEGKKDEHEMRWHDHPEVARLSHPQHEQDVPLADLITNKRHKRKQFKQHHFDKLKSLCAQHGFALDETHTLFDLHDALVSLYPGLRLPRY
jgi:hypothetical protein